MLMLMKLMMTIMTMTTMMVLMLMLMMPGELFVMLMALSILEALDQFHPIPGEPPYP